MLKFRSKGLKNFKTTADIMLKTECISDETRDLIIFAVEQVEESLPEELQGLKHNIDAEFELIGTKFVIRLYFIYRSAENLIMELSQSVIEDKYNERR